MLEVTLYPYLRLAAAIRARSRCNINMPYCSYIFRESFLALDNECVQVETQFKSVVTCQTELLTTVANIQPFFPCSAKNQVYK